MEVPSELLGQIRRARDQLGTSIILRPLGLMALPGREFAIAHGPQLMPKGLLADRDLELVPQPLGQVDDPPAHDPVDGRKLSQYFSV